MEDDQAYLEPGFDPNSLTIPRIRSILVAHNIVYPSSAKKAQLVEIFSGEVLPHARHLRAANARVKRTSRGIEDVPSTQSSVDGDAADDEPLPTPARRSTTRTSSRRTTRAQTEELDDDARLSTNGVRHNTAPPQQTPRRASSRKTRSPEYQYEEELAPPSTAKPSRSRTATPRFKREPINDNDNDSPFSNDNVFQSGTTPPAIYEPEKRRTTNGKFKSPEKRQSQDARSWLDEIRPTANLASEPPILDRQSLGMVSTRPNESSTIEPTEEFTPEEQQELVQAQQAGELVPVQRTSRSHAARTGPMAILLAMLTGIGAVWRQEKLEVGYCGVGRPTTELAGVTVPEWAEFLRPQCEPCPPHAYCGDRLETVCDADFVLTPHPLSFGGVVPIAPTCEPDSAKARKVNAVKERVLEELREQNAKYECGKAKSAVIKEPALKQAISTKRRKGMTNEEFEDLWASALGEVQGADEVIMGSDGSSGVFTLRSNSLARLPLACAVRRSLRETLKQYFWQLMIVLMVVASSSYGHFYLTTGAETERRAKELARLALDKLANQAALHAYDSDSYRDNYMSVAQLRDDILRDEFSAARRKNLWDKVQRKVEGNSNVRPMVREGRSGDIGRVWEWVGAVGMIENTPMSGDVTSRRKSGRVSWGGERVIESPSAGERSSVTKWAEGRQQYY